MSSKLIVGYYISLELTIILCFVVRRQTVRSTSLPVDQYAHIDYVLDRKSRRLVKLLLPHGLELDRASWQQPNIEKKTLRVLASLFGTNTNAVWGLVLGINVSVEQSLPVLRAARWVCHLPVLFPCVFFALLQTCLSVHEPAAEPRVETEVTLLQQKPLQNYCF